MRPLLEQILAMQDILTAGPGSAPTARPVAVKPASCRGCGGTGDMPSGRACNWCEAWDPDNAALASAQPATGGRGD